MKNLIVFFAVLISQTLVCAQNKMHVKTIKKSREEKNEEPQRSNVKIVFYYNGKVSQYPTQVFINKLQFTQDTLAIYEKKLFAGKYFFEFSTLGYLHILKKRIKVRRDYNYEISLFND